MRLNILSIAAFGVAGGIQLAHAEWLGAFMSWNAIMWCWFEYQARTSDR